MKVRLLKKLRRSANKLVKIKYRRRVYTVTKECMYFATQSTIIETIIETKNKQRAFLEYNNERRYCILQLLESYRNRRDY